MDFTSNYFEIFGLPVGYKIDLRLLADRYHQMQRKFHPDRYSTKPAQEQRLAVQYAAVIKQAYSELTSPLLRAQYLLSLSGIEGEGETSITRDPIFLMQQIELREALSEVRDATEPLTVLDQVAEEARGQYDELQHLFGRQYVQADIKNAVDTVAKMQFFSKLLNEVEQLEQELDDD